MNGFSNTELLQMNIARHFAEQYTEGMSTRDLLDVAEILLLKDFAELIIGCDPESMSKIDDLIRDTCSSFIGELRSIAKEVTK